MSIPTSPRCSAPPRRWRLSGVPFQGPIGAAKVGYKDGQYILNPTNTQLKESKLELVVAGTRRSAC